MGHPIPRQFRSQHPKPQWRYGERLAAGRSEDGQGHMAESLQSVDVPFGDGPLARTITLHKRRSVEKAAGIRAKCIGGHRGSVTRQPIMQGNPSATALTEAQTQADCRRP